MRYRKGCAHMSRRLKDFSMELTVKGPGGTLMLWGTFPWHRLGPHIPLEGRVNAPHYVTTLKSPCFPLCSISFLLEDLPSGETLKFMGNMMPIIFNETSVSLSGKVPTREVSDGRCSPCWPHTSDCWRTSDTWRKVKCKQFLPPLSRHKFPL